MIDCPKVDAAVEAAYISDMISYLRSKGYVVYKAYDGILFDYSLPEDSQEVTIPDSNNFVLDEELFLLAITTG